ncbi:hypothetical protein AAC387_Pa01g2489 [Persea americana]
MTPPPPLASPSMIFSSHRITLTSDSKPSPAVSPVSGSSPSLLEPTQDSAPVAAECPTLQELEFHRRTDDVLFRIASFENLQILRVIGFVEELYDDLASLDLGLSILAHDNLKMLRRRYLDLQRCRRLVSDGREIPDAAGAVACRRVWI